MGHHLAAVHLGKSYPNKQNNMSELRSQILPKNLLETIALLAPFLKHLRSPIPNPSFAVPAKPTATPETATSSVDKPGLGIFMGFSS